MRNQLGRRRRRTAGQGVVEYAIIIALIAVVVIAVMAKLGSRVAGAYCQVGVGLNSNNGGCEVMGFGDYDTGAVGIPNLGGDVWSPQQVPGLQDVIGVASSAGSNSSLAVDSQGRVWGWGWDDNGELGGAATVTCPAGGSDPAAPCAQTPEQIPGVPPAVGVSGSLFTSAAVGADGRVYMWGDNLDDIPSAGVQVGGSLGRNSTTVFTDTTPQPVVDCTGAAITGITEVSVSGNSNGSYTWAQAMALVGDGTVWAWGNNHYGQLGDGNTNDKPCAEKLALAKFGGQPVKQIVTNGATSLALTADGHVYSWGANQNGALGQAVSFSTWYQTATPAPVCAAGVATGTACTIAGGNVLSNIVQVADGPNDTAYAVGADGTLYGWGAAGTGELGQGSGTGTTDQAAPVVVQVAAGQPLTHVVQASAGNQYGLAVTSDGGVWAIGFNARGRAGLGSAITNAYYATQIPGVGGVKYASASLNHSLLVLGNPNS